MENRKKIFDIAPPIVKEQKPEKIERVLPQVKEKEIKPLIKEVEEAPEKIPSPKRAFKKKLIPILGGSLLLLAMSLSYFIIPAKANIGIWPKKNGIQEPVTVLVASSVAVGNYIPGKVLEADKTVSQNFTAQGRRAKSTKARGNITIFNEYSTAAQTLIATTRFVSDDGKLFRIPSKVTVPGSHYEGSKLVAGSISVEVVADQPGEEYNIDASTFSVPGFAGTPKYTSFYAKSSEPMQGGVKTEVSYVTQDDLDKAKESLESRALNEGGDAIRSAIASENYVLIDGAISVKTADFNASAELGQEATTFSAQVKALASSMVFTEEAVRNFSKDYIKARSGAGAKLIEDSFKVDYIFESVNLKDEEMVLKLVVAGQTYSLPEESEIKEMVAGKNMEEVASVLRALPQVERMEIKFWPFWVTNAPDQRDRINIALRLD